MKDKNGKEIKVGDKVVWYDPELLARDSERIWEVYELRGEIVCINDDFSEAEVFPSELEIVKPLIK